MQDSKLAASLADEGSKLWKDNDDDDDDNDWHDDHHDDKHHHDHWQVSYYMNTLST
jgi:hypothetical protein